VKIAVAGVALVGQPLALGAPIDWSPTPTKWSNHFFENLFGNEWELTKSPAGAYQWQAKDAEATIPGSISV
jgi:catalase-peroxidase